jgi:hypothetical protein
MKNQGPKLKHKNFKINDGLVTLIKPLSRADLKTLHGSKDTTVFDGRISVNIVVDLSDLLDLQEGISDLNDLADNKILADGACLSDISYTVMGVIPGSGKGTVSGSIIINVNADISDLL